MVETLETLIVAAAALVAPDGRVLLQQRPAGTAMAGLWEFPGGKIEPGETCEAGLVRELWEELGIKVAFDSLQPVTFASAFAKERPLLLLLYVCRDWAGEPRALHASALRLERVEAMADLPMPPADYPMLGPLMAMLATVSMD